MLTLVFWKRYSNEPEVYSCTLRVLNLHLYLIKILLAISIHQGSSPSLPKQYNSIIYSTELILVYPRDNKKREGNFLSEHCSPYLNGIFMLKQWISGNKFGRDRGTNVQTKIYYNTKTSLRSVIQNLQL